MQHYFSNSHMVVLLLCVCCLCTALGCLGPFLSTRRGAADVPQLPPELFKLKFTPAAGPGAVWDSADMLGSFPCVGNLQRLQLSRCLLRQPVLQLVQQAVQLTRLELVEMPALALQANRGVSFSQLSRPEVAVFRALRSIDPALVCSLPGRVLRELAVVGPRREHPAIQGAAGVALLLQKVADLPALLALDLTNAFGTITAANGYPALLAPPRLSCLKLAIEQMFPEEAAGGVGAAPAGQPRAAPLRYPALLQLEISSRLPQPRQQRYHPAHLQRISSCCPNLQQLLLQGVLLQRGWVTVLDSLRQLTALSTTDIGGTTASDVANLLPIQHHATACPHRGWAQNLLLLCSSSCM